MDDKLRKQMKRKDPVFREKERERERNRKRLRRKDPLYRAAERNRDKLRRRALRAHLQICTEEWQRQNSNFSLDFIPVETILKEECEKLPNTIEVSSVVCSCLPHECKCLSENCDTIIPEDHALQLYRCNIPLNSEVPVLEGLNQRVTDVTMQEDLVQSSSAALFKLREQDRLRKQRKRQNATYRALERERQRIRKRLLRADPLFRSREREQQRLTVSFQRHDPEYRALIKLHQKCSTGFSLDFIPVETVLKEECQRSLNLDEIPPVMCTCLKKDCTCLSASCETNSSEVPVDFNLNESTLHKTGLEFPEGS